MLFNYYIALKLIDNQPEEEDFEEEEVNEIQEFRNIQIERRIAAAQAAIARVNNFAALLTSAIRSSVPSVSTGLFPAPSTSTEEVPTQSTSAGPLLLPSLSAGIPLTPSVSAGSLPTSSTSEVTEPLMSEPEIEIIDEREILPPHRISNDQQEGK